MRPRSLARAGLDLDALASLPDDEVRARIVAIRGLGEWTAEWFLARHLARPHAWPWGDLALRKAVAFGSVMASFNVEDFSLRRMSRLTNPEIQERMRTFRQMLELEIA